MLYFAYGSNLDLDQMREHLTKGLTFSRTDRDTNVQRIAYVARLLAKHGVLALISLIAPYEQTRLDIRRRSEAEGHPFFEVFVHAPLDTVVARDVKGLYKRALAGELPNFTGVSDPYEAPVDPTLEIRRKARRRLREDAVVRRFRRPRVNVQHSVEHLQLRDLAAQPAQLGDDASAVSRSQPLSGDLPTLRRRRPGSRSREARRPSSRAG